MRQFSRFLRSSTGAYQTWRWFYSLDSPRTVAPRPRACSRKLSTACYSRPNFNPLPLATTDSISREMCIVTSRSGMRNNRAFAKLKGKQEERERERKISVNPLDGPRSTAVAVTLTVLLSSRYHHMVAPRTRTRPRSFGYLRPRSTPFSRGHGLDARSQENPRIKERNGEPSHEGGYISPGDKRWLDPRIENTGRDAVAAFQSEGGDISNRTFPRTEHRADSSLFLGVRGNETAMECSQLPSTANVGASLLHATLILIPSKFFPFQ